MSKKKKNPRSYACAPMLVMRGLHNDKLETVERMAVDAFAYGWAEAVHYNTLADMQGSMMLAATTKPELRQTAEYCRDVVGPVLNSIVRRWQKTNKFGCSGPELEILRKFVTKHREFWLRQPLLLYQQAYAKMRQVQTDLRKSGQLKSE